MRGRAALPRKQARPSVDLGGVEADLDAGPEQAKQPNLNRQEGSTFMPSRHVNRDVHEIADEKEYSSPVNGLADAQLKHYVSQA